MQKKFIEVRDGVITGTLSVDMPGDAKIPEALIEVPMDTDLTDLPFRTYVNGQVGAKALPPPVRTVSRLDFARLFTPQERIATRKRRQAGDAVADVLDDFYALVELAGSVNLDHPDVGAGLAFMVQQDLLTPERAAAILDGHVPETK